MKIMELLVGWLLGGLSVLIVAHIVPGFVIRGFLSALVAALVIGLVNSTLGIFLKVLTFPLTILTLGLFWLVINALMLELAAWLVPGFSISGFFPAFLGAILLSLTSLALRYLVLP